MFPPLPRFPRTLRSPRTLRTLRSLHALHSADECLRQPGREVRVLAEALLGTAPARVPGDVQRGDEGHVAAAGTEFGGGMRGGPLEQGGVPGGADGQVDGKDRAVEGHVAVRDLLDEQGGDAQAAAFQDVALDQVGEVGAVVGPGSVAVVDAGPGVGAHQTVEGAEAREALGLGVQGVGEFEVSVPGTAVGVPAVHPLVELADLLAPGHAGQKVGDAGVEGAAGSRYGGCAGAAAGATVRS